jgi:nudix-type nucleoside diphosphatase (YffH/AdpP family)
LFNGGTSAELDRAIFLSGDAAIVLPYDPVRDRVLVVEQFRMGPVGRGDPHAWQIEPIAGRIDAGETGVQAALRETKEEADLDISVLEPVAELYPSPGTSTEFYYLYVGLADLPDDIAGLNGLATEHEDIRTHVMTLDALLDMVDNMQVANAPLVLLTYWVARHRERLRALS